MSKSSSRRCAPLSSNAEARSQPQLRDLELPPKSQCAVKLFRDVLKQPNDPHFIHCAYFAATFEELGDQVKPGDLVERACLGLQQLHEHGLGTRAAAVAASLLAAAVCRVVSRHPCALAAAGDFVRNVLNLAVLGDVTEREMSDEDLDGLQREQLAASTGLAAAASPLALGIASVARFFQVQGPELAGKVFEAPEITQALRELFDQHLSAPSPIKDSLLPLMLCVPKTSRATVRAALAPVLDKRMAALVSQLTELRQRTTKDAALYACWLVDVLALFYPVDDEQKPLLGWLAP